MKRSLLVTALLLSLSGLHSTAYAGGLALNKHDCEEILRRWAADPNSVPKALVDACKEVLAAESVVPNIEPAAGSAADPCADSASANLVQCWGPWKTVAPAAGPAIALNLPVLPPDLRPEEEGGQGLGGETTGGSGFQLAGCTPGTGCGFATIEPGAGTTPGPNSRVVHFDMNTDGSQFVVDPGGSGQLMSLSGLTRSSTPGPARYQRVDGTTASQLVIFQGGPDATGTINQAAGLWRHGDTTGQGPLSAGAAVWGITSSQATMDSLNAGNVTARFSGNMSGDTSTVANMTVNFGTQPNWTGSWQNPNYSFQAGGGVSGVDLMSNPGQFSSNVKAGSVVQGALYGTAGNQSVGHAVSVVLDNGAGGETRVNDVGLLKQVP